MTRSFKETIERLQAETAKIQADVVEGQRQLEIEKRKTYVELTLKAQQIEDVQVREMLISDIRDICLREAGPLRQKKTPSPRHS